MGTITPVKNTSPKKIEDIAKKKELFKKYYRQLPIIKLSAGKVGISRETIYKWIKEDLDFANQIEAIKFDFALENLPQVKSKEWVLERVLREYFSPRQEITGEEGKQLPIPIMCGETILGRLVDTRLDKNSEENNS
jgi:hypothetical protein